jgi:hypothetical protein
MRAESMAGACRGYCTHEVVFCIPCSQYEPWRNALLTLLQRIASGRQANECGALGPVARGYTKLRHHDLGHLVNASKRLSSPLAWSRRVASFFK